MEWAETLAPQVSARAPIATPGGDSSFLVRPYLGGKETWLPFVGFCLVFAQGFDVALFNPEVGRRSHRSSSEGQGRTLGRVEG